MGLGVDHASERTHRTHSDIIALRHQQNRFREQMNISNRRAKGNAEDGQGDNRSAPASIATLVVYTLSLS